MRNRKLKFFLTGLAVTATLSAAAVAPLQQANASRIALVQAKINAAQTYFARSWGEMFRTLGAPFTAPRVIAFLKSSNTACGVVNENNGFYCPKDNSIYLDAAFLEKNMTQASAVLKTDGDYAPIAIAAHEFGHVVASQLNAVSPDKEFASEQVADCFAGVITRRAKNDGVLEAGDLAEGLYALSQAGDEVGAAGNMKNLSDRLRFIVRQGGLSHGFVVQRQGAFMQGYYGGAAFCATRLGVARPPIANRTITVQNLLGIRAESGRACRYGSESAGLRIRNSATSGACTFNLLGTTLAVLPNHARIELTVMRLAGANGAGLSGSAGIYFGDFRSTAGGARFGFSTNEAGGVGILNLDHVMETFGGLRVDGMPWNLDKINKLGENRLTLDMHHEGPDVYFMEFVNGYITDFAHTQLAGTIANRRAPDEAGILLQFPGNEAIFKDFRVSVLPE